VFSPRAAGSLLLWSAAALAAEGDVQLSTQAGYDSNVRRDYDQVGTVSDAEVSLVGSAEGRVQGDSTQAFGAYDVGLRKFLQYPSEDTLAQAVNGETSWRASPHWTLGVQTRGKDRRGGERDYTDLMANAFAEWKPDLAVTVRGWAGAHRFLYWDAFNYSYDAPELGFSGRWRLDRHHALFASADVGPRTYNGLLNLSSGDVGTQVRQDTAWNVTAGYAYRGPFTASVSYNFFAQRSNSYGESMTRHRLVATGGFRLPWKLYALVEGALQYTVFPNGIYLSPEILLVEDDENTSALSAKLVRPLDEHVDAEAHGGVYYDQLPDNGLTYFRAVAWVGLSWRL
jgi:hypothetical protein